LYSPGKKGGIAVNALLKRGVTTPIINAKDGLSKNPPKRTGICIGRKIGPPMPKE